MGHNDLHGPEGDSGRPGLEGGSGCLYRVEDSRLDLVMADKSRHEKGLVDTGRPRAVGLGTLDEKAEIGEGMEGIERDGLSFFPCPRFGYDSGPVLLVFHDLRIFAWGSWRAC